MQEKYELVTWNIRRLVGALWQQVEGVEEVAVSWGSLTAWHRPLARAWKRVEDLCRSCAGRGWKRKLIREMRLADWKVAKATFDEFSVLPRLFWAGWDSHYFKQPHILNATSRRSGIL